MSNTKSKAQEEFDILEKTVKDPTILPFKDEILALVDKFGDSGQSGGSAPFVSTAISKAVKNLCMQQPICPITGIDEEWVDQSEASCGKPWFQNIRCSAVFKHSIGGKPYYLDAIVFRGENGACFTSGSVELPSGGTIGSRQYIRFPFKPKTFYIDVIETKWEKNKDTGELVEKDGGGWWSSIVKDESQLNEVWEYYDKYSTNLKENVE